MSLGAVLAQRHPALLARLSAALEAGSLPVVVTGAGGWLGRATLDLLHHLLGQHLPDRVFVYGSQARALALPSGRKIPCRVLADLAAYRGAPPLVLHYACLTKDRVADLDNAAYLTANAGIRESVAAFVTRVGARGVFLPSSGAVYGPQRTLATDAATNPYGVGKLRDEARFNELADAHGIPLVIARVFNLAGPYINKPAVYALASFVLDALADRPIEIHARGPVMRSYIHVGDLLLLALGALLLAPSPAPVRFDTAGEETVEVEDLAHRVAALLGRPDLAIHRADMDGRAADVYVGDATAMRALAAALGLPLSGLDAQIRDTAAFLGSTAA